MINLVHALNTVPLRTRQLNNKSQAKEQEGHTNTKQEER